MLRPFRTVRLLMGLAAATCVAGAASAQDADEEEFVVVKAGRVITMAGPELQDVDILLVDGKIRLVGKDLSYPRTAKVIDARREVIMPGMIHPRTRWQLQGIQPLGSARRPVRRTGNLPVGS